MFVATFWTAFCQLGVSDIDLCIFNCYFRQGLFLLVSMNTQASPKDKPVYHNMCKDETSRIRNFKDRKVGLPPSCLGYFGIALQEIEATVGWDRGVVCCRFGRWMLDCMGSKRWGSARISGWRGTEHTEHRVFPLSFEGHRHVQWFLLLPTVDDTSIIIDKDDVGYCGAM